jgi:hypothetical protein
MKVQYTAHPDHPTESDVLDLVLGQLDEPVASEVAGHVRSCLTCRTLVERLRLGVPDLPDADLPTTAAAPAAAVEAVVNADRPDAGPAAGELWRAQPSAGGPVTVVWLREVGPSGALAVPVTFDVEMADEHTVVVPAEASPLGLSLAVFGSAEGRISLDALRDRLGAVDLAAASETIAADPSAGTPLVSDLDQRLQYRHALIDAMGEFAAVGSVDESPEDDRWWPLVGSSDRAELVETIHRTLAESHPSARISPRAPAAAGSEQLEAVALVSELDAFVLVAALHPPLDGQALLEAARQVLHADHLLSAVCAVDPVTPYEAVIVDRRDVVAAIETPSGELRAARQSRPPASVGDALSKYLDATVSPFRRLAATIVDVETIASRDLAVDVAAEAVRTVEASARGYKVEGKRSGYERVTRYRGSIVRLVEQALTEPDVDVASILEEPE